MTTEEKVARLRQLLEPAEGLARMIRGTLAYADNTSGSGTIVAFMAEESERQLDVLAHASALTGELREGYMAELNETCRPLAVALGFPRGPFPEICPECRGGCLKEEVCREHVEWGEHTSVTLAEMAAERIRALEQRVSELSNAIDMWRYGS